MQIAGIQKTTLVDYPGHVAATVFTRGCNFRCPYCHNPELVVPAQFISTIAEEDFWTFLRKRQGKLEGVCITGGEPTLHPDLPQFISRIKSLGFLVKLDSNGSNPEKLATIIKQKLVDYIAMDIKGPLGRYNNIANPKGIYPKGLGYNIKKSIELIMSSDVDYEFRTTVAKPLLNLADMVGIGLAIKGAKRYFLQNYVHSKQVDASQPLFPFSQSELVDAQTIMRRFVESVDIR